MVAAGHIGEITAFVAALQAFNTGDLGNDELADRCLAAVTLVDIATAHAAELAAEFEARGTWAGDGATSGTAWVASRTGHHRAELARRARIGAALRDLPAVAAAARRGEVSFDHVCRIVDCARRAPGLGDAEEA